MTNFLVLGLPKTGTSALHAAIKRACAPLCMFEPGNWRQMAFLRRAVAENKLAKVMLPVLSELRIEPGSFDKTVLIVRDPRDSLISWLLYRPLLPRNCKNSAFTDDLLAALRRKEADPKSLSVQQLFGVLDRHAVPYTRNAECRQQLDLVLELERTDRSHFTQRYEEFVDGKVDALSRYLGLEIAPRPKVEEHISFVDRSRSYGGWRSWFLPSDVECYGPVFEDFLEYFGYDRTWQLEESPVIDPAFSSGYVQRNLERLKDLPNDYGELKRLPIYGSAYLALLQSAAADGAEAAMVELALAHKYGYGVPRSMERALALLESARERGNPMAMAHLGILYERGDGVPQDITRARGLFTETGAVRGNRRAKKQIERLRRTYPRGDHFPGS